MKCYTAGTKKLNINLIPSDKKQEKVKRQKMQCIQTAKIVKVEIDA